MATGTWTPPEVHVRTVRSTSAGVYIPCIYSHARWVLRQATRLFVVCLCDVFWALINSHACWFCWYQTDKSSCIPPWGAQIDCLQDKLQPATQPAMDGILYWAVPVWLLGGSGEVVNSLDFYPALLKSLGRFYFWCILSSKWKAVAVNLQSLHCPL